MRSIAKLLQDTAQRYRTAVSEVLDEWQPECNCSQPGGFPHCEACPSFAIFEQRVQEKILRLAQSSQPKQDLLIPLQAASNGHQP